MNSLREVIDEWLSILHAPVTSHASGTSVGVFQMIVFCVFVQKRAQLQLLLLPPSKVSWICESISHGNVPSHAFASLPSECDPIWSLIVSMCLVVLCLLEFWHAKMNAIWPHWISCVLSACHCLSCKRNNATQDRQRVLHKGMCECDIFLCPSVLQQLSV